MIRRIRDRAPSTVPTSKRNFRREPREATSLVVAQLAQPEIFVNNDEHLVGQRPGAIAP
jgi:hypothetical protein